MPAGEEFSYNKLTLNMPLFVPKFLAPEFGWNVSPRSPPADAHENLCKDFALASERHPGQATGVWAMGHCPSPHNLGTLKIYNLFFLKISYFTFLYHYVSKFSRACARKLPETPCLSQARAKKGRFLTV